MSLVLELIWEWLENGPGVSWFQWWHEDGYSGDSVVNSCTDVAVCWFGAWLTSWFV